MKVKELVARLQKLHPEFEVLCYTEDSAVLPPNHGIRLFDIDATSVVEGEVTRGDDQIPSLKLAKGPQSQKLAVIEITSDF